VVEKFENNLKSLKKDTLKGFLKLEFKRTIKKTLDKFILVPLLKKRCFATSLATQFLSCKLQCETNLVETYSTPRGALIRNVQEKWMLGIPSDFQLKWRDVWACCRSRKEGCPLHLVSLVPS
jgi:hypothetical protein